MKIKLPNLETLFLLFLSAVLIATRISGIYLTALKLLFTPWFLEKRTDIFAQLILFYGMVLLILAVLSYWFSLNDTTLLHQIIQPFKDSYSVLRKEVLTILQRGSFFGNHAVWILLALAIGAGIRGYFLSSRSFSYDEAYTFLNFVNGRFPDLFNYPVPNNHVLHTILVKVSTLIWGSHPASIRLPALLAGVGLIPLTYLLSRALGNERSGKFTAIAITVSPYLVLYSCMARGYTLLALLTVALALAGQKFVHQPSGARAALLSTIAALGMMTMPSMLFPIAGIYGWIFLLMLIDKRTLRNILSEYVLPCGLLTALITIILYTPVILVSNGIQGIVANSTVQSQPWQSFVPQIYPHIRDTFREFNRDVPAVLLYICILFVVAGLYASFRKGYWATFLLLPSILIGAAILFLMQHRIPFPRTWIYVIPFFLLLADTGFTYLTEKFAPLASLSSQVLLVLVAGFFAVSLISKDTVAKYQDFPEAPIVVKYLKPVLTSNDRIHVDLGGDWQTFFYLWYYRVPKQGSQANSGPGRDYFIVNKVRYSIKDMTSEPTTKIFDYNNSAVYQLDTPPGPK